MASTDTLCGVAVDVASTGLPYGAVDDAQATVHYVVYDVASTVQLSSPTSQPSWQWPGRYESG
jgi:hypothetical protein